MGVQNRDGSLDMKKDDLSKIPKGKLLVLGGSGFLGGTVARRAILEGYSVTSLSRRGKVPSSSSEEFSFRDNASGSITLDSIDYRKGDAREKYVIESILAEGGYVAIIHCIGLLFDGESGLGNINRFVSGSGSIPDNNSTYDDITTLTALNAIEAAEEYAKVNMNGLAMPFIFTSAAEAGWPDVEGGSFVENTLAPTWLKRYLEAKRAVESRLTKEQNYPRPIIFRPSLIFSYDRIASLPPVGAFFVGNMIGLPFVDRPVTVQALSCAIVRSIGNDQIRG